MPFNNLLLAAFLIGLFTGDSRVTSDSQRVTPFAEPYVSQMIEIPASEVELHPNEGLMYWQDQPLTGIVLSDDQRRFTERVHYRNGKRNGLREQWFKDGTPRLKAAYKSGKLHGEYLSWWQNGNLRTRGNYVNGKVQGEFIQYYQEGMIFKKMQYQMGKEDGLQQAWRRNGKLYTNYEAKNGRIFGLKRANLCYELKDEEL